VRLEGLGKLIKIHLTGTRTRDLPACSIFFIIFFLLVGWDFGYCGHYWFIVPARDDMVIVKKLVE
jgi:hypothetical protein